MNYAKTIIFALFSATRCHSVLWEDPCSTTGEPKRQWLVSSYLEFFLPIDTDTDLLYVLRYILLYMCSDKQN